MGAKVSQFSILLISLVVSLPFLGINFAFADSWWGYGARDKDWILKHGGTIVRCEIENISGDAKEYKMVMFDVNDRYVEKEFGKGVVFDDAKDGVYKIRAYRGGTADGTTWKGGKKFAAIEFTAHPGETIKIKFNYKNKSAKMTTDYVKLVPKPKPVAKTLPANEPVAEPSNEPVQLTETKLEQVNDNGQCVATSKPVVAWAEGGLKFEREDVSFIESVEDFVHPDAMAMESGQQKIIKQGDSSQQAATEEESINIFKRIWISLVKFFILPKISHESPPF